MESSLVHLDQAAFRTWATIPFLRLNIEGYLRYVADNIQHVQPDKLDEWLTTNRSNWFEKPVPNQPTWTVNNGVIAVRTADGTIWVGTVPRQPALTRAGITQMRPDIWSSLVQELADEFGERTTDLHVPYSASGFSTELINLYDNLIVRQAQAQ